MCEIEHDPKKLEKLINESIEFVEEIKNKHSEVSQQMGYIGDVLRGSKDIYIKMRDCNSEDYRELTISGTSFIGSLHNDLESIRQETNHLHSRVEFASGIMDTQSATNSTIAYINPFFKDVTPEYEPNPIIQRKDRNYYADKLTKLDESLGKTYKQIWEVYYTNSEPERSALYQIRQTFDHLFSILAPDEDVRNSTFWKRKEENNPLQIHRKERLIFAANNHISDIHKRDYIISNTKQILDTYQLLNQAHKRGELDKKAAKKALFSMDKILQNWIDALDL